MATIANAKPPTTPDASPADLATTWPPSSNRSCKAPANHPRERGLPKCSPFAEANFQSLGLTEWHVSGCLRSDHSCRTPTRFTGRPGGREVREVFGCSPRLRRASERLWNEASTGRAAARIQENLGLACPPVLP